MLEMLISAMVESVGSIMEKGLLGVFALAEIFNSDNTNEKYAIVLVILFTLCVATLWYLSKDYVHILLRKKRKKSKKSKGSSSSKGSTNKASTRVNKKGSTKIKSKKHATPGVKKTRKKVK